MTHFWNSFAGSLKINYKNNMLGIVQVCNVTVFALICFLMLYVFIETIHMRVDPLGWALPV